MMEESLLALKWSKHNATFFQMLANARIKECYTDVSLACEGKFYKVHKFVLSTCSEYFEQIFDETQCQHPVIVLKGIRREELESLLSYMYIGEVNVAQEKLADLIKAAECLRIKGLAVPDEDDLPNGQYISSEKRAPDGESDQLHKRRKQADTLHTTEGVLPTKRDHKRSSLSTSAHISFKNYSQVDFGEIKSVESVNCTDLDVNQVVTSIKSEGNAVVYQDKSPVICEDIAITVKKEPADCETSNPAQNSEEIFNKNLHYVDGQQHFMDEVIDSDPGNLMPADVSTLTMLLQRPPQLPQKLDWSSHQRMTHSTSQEDFLGEHKFNSSTSSNHNISTIADPSESFGETTGSGACFSDLHSMDASDESQEHSLLTPVSQLDLSQLVTETRLYRCPVCDRESRSKVEFVRHYMTHSGEKPFSCNYCTYKATRKYTLIRHIKTLHPERFFTAGFLS